MRTPSANILVQLPRQPASPFSTVFSSSFSSPCKLLHRFGRKTLKLQGRGGEREEEKAKSLGWRWRDREVGPLGGVVEGGGGGGIYVEEHQHHPHPHSTTH